MIISNQFGGGDGGWAGGREASQFSSLLSISFTLALNMKLIGRGFIKAKPPQSS